MKIRKVKYANHPILGDLVLDFVNPKTNEPYSTIVLAGENGTGKTTILETLNTFLSIGSFEPFQTFEYEVENFIESEKHTYILEPLNSGTSKNFFKRYDPITKKYEEIISDKVYNTDNIQKDDKDPRFYGSVFSRPRADYKTNKITSVTTNELDKNKYNSDNDENFTSLKQLIVDVQNQDNNEYSKINKERGPNPMSFDEFKPKSKIHRFESAFNGFFETIKYKGVDNANGAKEVFFEKNGKEIPLDALSTGEKQIVFRGAYLLRNLNLLENSTIMIDEPELSMHPLWQKKILKYYKDLFTTNSQQTAQLFFASHSEAVISEALQDLDNTKVIVLKNVNGQVVANCIDTPAVLPYTLAAEVNYQAFGLSSTDYHNALYGYIEAEVWKKDFEAQHQNTITNYTYEKGAKKEIWKLTLTEKIRHIIHHPENKNNSYTQEELETSINFMRTFIQGKKSPAITDSSDI